MTIEKAIEMISCEMVRNDEYMKINDTLDCWDNQEPRVYYVELQKAYKIALKCMENCEIVYGKVYVEVLKDEPKKD